MICGLVNAAADAVSDALCTFVSSRWKTVLVIAALAVCCCVALLPVAANNAYLDCCHKIRQHVHCIYQALCLYLYSGKLAVQVNLYTLYMITSLQMHSEGRMSGPMAEG